MFIQKVFLLIYNLFKYYYSLLIISSSFCKKTSRPDSISKNDHENNEVIVLEELDKGKQNFEENKSNIKDLHTEVVWNIVIMLWKRQKGWQKIKS